MELIFEKNSIQINNKECDLENFKDQEFFVIYRLYQCCKYGYSVR